MTRLEQTRQAFMAGVHKMVKRAPRRGDWRNGEWRIGFGPPHCCSLGPSHRRERESRPGMIHTVTVPESWLEDVYAPGIAVIDDVLILAAAKARCDYEGAEAWRVVSMSSSGRKVRPSQDYFLVRFGGLTMRALNVDVAFSAIQCNIRVELGLDWETRFGKDR